MERLDMIDLAHAAIRLAEVSLRADVAPVDLTQAAMNVIVWIGKTLPDVKSSAEVFGAVPPIILRRAI
jgi:hypothetical protein